MTDNRDFAVAWVAAWAALRGTVRPADETFGTPPRDLTPEPLAEMIVLGRPVPEFYAPRFGVPAFGAQAHLRLGNASEWTGALRALEHLATAVPGGIAAILEVVSGEGTTPDAPQKPFTAQREEI